MFTMVALDSQGSELRTVELAVASLANKEAWDGLVLTARDAFDVMPNAVTVLIRKGTSFIAAVHKTEDGGTMTRSITDWWNKEPLTDTPDGPSLAAYNGSRTAERVWDSLRPEVEAWARLRAALRGLGGDL